MESLDAVPIVSPSVRRNHVTCWTACYPKAPALDSPPPSLRPVECCAPLQLCLRFLWGQDGWSGPTSVCRMILSLTNAFKTCSLCLTTKSHSGGRSLTSRFYRDWRQRAATARQRQRCYGDFSFFSCSGTFELTLLCMRQHALWCAKSHAVACSAVNHQGTACRTNFPNCTTLHSTLERSYWLN